MGISGLLPCQEPAKSKETEDHRGSKVKPINCQDGMCAEQIRMENLYSLKVLFFSEETRTKICLPLEQNAVKCMKFDVA